MDPAASKGTADRVKHILKAMENSIDAVRRKRLGQPATGPAAGSHGFSGNAGTSGHHGTHGNGGFSGVSGSGVASAGYHNQGGSYAQGGTAARAVGPASSQRYVPSQNLSGQPGAYGHSAGSEAQRASSAAGSIGSSGQHEATIGRAGSPEPSQNAYPFARPGTPGGANANAPQQTIGGAPGQPGTTPAPGMRLKAKPKRLDPSMVKDFNPGAYRSQAG